MIKYLLLIIIMFSSYKAYASDFVIKNEPDPNMVIGIDERVQPYVKTFEKISGLRVIIPIGIIEITDKEERGKKRLIVGECQTWGDEKGNIFNQIVIDKLFYNLYRFNFNRMENLIWHELGHCALGIDEHDDTRLKEDEFCPNSLMNSEGFGDEELSYCYIKYKKHYEKDLFTIKGKIIINP